MSRPDRQIRWGIVGTARIATKVCRAIHQAAGSAAAAVASRDRERARRWASEHGVERAHGSYHELVDDPGVDVVYVALPNSLHAEWTVRAAEVGKHVLCEKPLAANLAEAEGMIAACREHGVQLMDATMWKHHARTAAMRAEIDRGRLGELRRVTAAFTLRWDPIPEDDIRFQRELAGGALGDLGWYCVGAGLWALGDLPTRVWATARWFREVELALSGFMWFDGDRVAAFDCGYDTVFRKWFEVAGTDGSIVCDDFVAPRDSGPPRYWLHGADGESGERVVDDAPQEVRMVERFAAIVRSGRLETGWAAEAARVQRVCDALGESARRGEPIELRPR